MTGSAAFWNTTRNDLKIKNTNEINGFVPAASDDGKRRELGQIGIFSPPRSQLS
jgi:hypothetical protein